ncbi:hypothetical protein [Methylacidimicrobium cyclopophantes]|nr:hypothetical protein [Methylacidimicrobium cyclopophantes]
MQEIAKKAPTLVLASTAPFLPPMLVCGWPRQVDPGSPAAAGTLIFGWSPPVLAGRTGKGS